jgi:hypothetical protein
MCMLQHSKYGVLCQTQPTGSTSLYGLTLLYQVSVCTHIIAIVVTVVALR